jgi:hypothetical protein
MRVERACMKFSGKIMIESVNHGDIYYYTETDFPESGLRER